MVGLIVRWSKVKLSCVVVEVFDVRWSEVKLSCVVVEVLFVRWSEVKLSCVVGEVFGVLKMMFDKIWGVYEVGEGLIYIDLYFVYEVILL